ncbi:MAG: amino acid ABC transporter substrate-binding protein [Pseudomonadota bacterium]
MRTTQRLLGAALCCLLWPPPATAQASPTLDRIRARGAIVIAHREASIPLSYLAGEQPVGYSIDLCRRLAEAVARQLGLKAWRTDYRLVTSSTRFEVIERGEADLECGSTTNTAQRRRRVAFTIPHFIAASRLMVRSAQPFERIEDLDRRTVASTRGTTNIDSLAREAQLKGVTLNVVASRDHAEGVAWVLQGKVDGFAMDDVLLYGLRASAPQPQALKVIGKPMTIEPYAIAFSRDDPALKRLIDAEMRRLIATGELQRLYDKWFLRPIPPQGINLGMRMPRLLADSLKYPSDYVPN